MLLKLIAVFSMLIDHIALLYFDGNPWMRMIGRIAFPLFSYLVVYNYLHRTTNKVSYIFSLSALGLVSQPFYNYAMGHTFHLNVLVLFSTGLMVIFMIESIANDTKNRWNIFFNIMGISVAYNVVFYCEYNIAGLMLMLSFYLVERTRKSYLFILSFLALALTVTHSPWILKMGVVLSFLIIVWHHFYPRIDDVIPYQRKIKWTFYLFYPLHLGLLRWMKF